MLAPLSKITPIACPRVCTDGVRAPLQPFQFSSKSPQERLALPERNRWRSLVSPAALWGSAVAAGPFLRGAAFPKVRASCPPMQMSCKRVVSSSGKLSQFSCERSPTPKGSDPKSIRAQVAVLSGARALNAAPASQSPLRREAGRLGATARTEEQLIPLLHGRWSLSTDLHSLSSNLFSRQRSRFQQQIYAPIRIQKRKQENHTRPGGFLIGTASCPVSLRSRLRFQLLAELPPPPGHQPTNSTSATARRAVGKVSATPLLPPGSSSAASLGFGNDGEAEGAWGGRQAAPALSLHRSVGSLWPARVRL